LKSENISKCIFYDNNHPPEESFCLEGAGRREDPVMLLYVTAFVGELSSSYFVLLFFVLYSRNERN
jgi:hypothetical protein